MEKEKEVSSKKVFEGKIINVRVDTVKLSSGNKATREVVEHPGAVVIVAVTRENEIVLVRQYRRAAGEVVLELPAGTLKKGEAGDDCARRELGEETGFHARKVVKIGEAYASPGYSDEILQYYLAKDMARLKQNTEEDEKIEVDLVDFELCLDLIKTGKIRDNKTIVGVMLARELMEG